MSIKDEIQADLEELEGDIGEVPTITFQAKTYPCIPSTLKRGLTVVVGGRQEEISLTVYIRKNAMPVPVSVSTVGTTADTTSLTGDNSTIPPQSGQKLTHKLKAYKVLAVGDPPASSHWEIDLGSINR